MSGNLHTSSPEKASRTPRTFLSSKHAAGIAASFGAVVIAAVAYTAPAHAKDETKYGALAVDRSNGMVYGFSYDHPSRAAAEARALEEGRKRGGKPAIVVSWSGPGCAAYRTIDAKAGNAYGWGLANTRQEAEAIALREVQKRSKGAPANSHVWGCNSKTSAPQKIYRNEPVGPAGGALVLSHSGYLTSVQFAPDGKTVATSSSRSGVQTWSLRTGAVERTFNGIPRSANLAFSPDGTRLAATDNKQLFIWNARTGAVIAERKHDALLMNLAYSRDGTRLYAVGAQESYDGPVQGWVMWTLNGKDANIERKTTLLEAHTHGYFGADYSPQGDVVVTAGDKPGRTLKFWNAVSGEAVKVVNSPKPRSVEIAPDGRTMATATNDGAIVWDMSMGSEIRRFGSGVMYDARFSPDGKRLATAQRNGLVTIWDVATGQQHAQGEGHTKLVTHLAFSPDGKYLASGSEDGDVRIWNVATGAPLAASTGRK